MIYFNTGTDTASHPSQLYRRKARKLLVLPSSTTQTSFPIQPPLIFLTNHSHEYFSKMHFSSLFTPVVALLATTVSASPIEKRAVTADQMVTTINKITQQSKSLTTIANKVNAMNGIPLLGPSSGSGSTNFNDIISGFQGIIQTGTTAIQDMSGTAHYTDTAAEQEVCDAFANVSFFPMHDLPAYLDLTVYSLLSSTRTCSRSSLASPVFCRASSSAPLPPFSAHSRESLM
jgi:hypothetical protein